MSPITNAVKFKGEIETYLRNGQNHLDSRIDRVFTSLKIKTWLCKANIIKKDGYHAAHLLLVLTILPLLKIKTVHSFCKKHWQHWSMGRKDTFYRFKENASYRWRTFFYKVNAQIFKETNVDQLPQNELHAIIDDSILIKLGKMLENVCYHYDHNVGRSVLGYCIVTLGILTGHGFYPVDFAYYFSKKRNAKTPFIIGDPRSNSGQRSFEAEHYTKLELAFMLLERAVNAGILPGYVLFDSWYAWPVLINRIRNLKDKSIHVICRLKDSKVKYEYKSKKYQLSELYQKVKHSLRKDHRTGLLLKRVTVLFPGSDEKAVIIFSRGYCEPQIDETKGKKKKKEPKWVAFLSTDTRLQAVTIIKKYTMRWPIEVCFKECKQMLDLGKDQSNDFNAQVFGTTASFMRYNLLNYMNKFDNHATLGELFNEISDQAAVFSYAHRLWDFFRGLFMVSFSTLFEILKINEEFHPYFDALTDTISDFGPFQGCET
jgi:DDE superfamily endonuclease